MNKPTARTTTTAKVTVTLELTNLGSWGPGCQIDQVYRQAKEEAVRRITKLCQGSSVKIISAAKVEAMTTEVHEK